MKGKGKIIKVTYRKYLQQDGDYRSSNNDPQGDHIRNEKGNEDSRWHHTGGVRHARRKHRWDIGKAQGILWYFPRIKGPLCL